MGMRQNNGHFNRQTSEISNKKTGTWRRKGNLKRKIESLLRTTKNNAIRTNYIKSKIDKTQQDISCTSCGDRDETISHIKSECSKVVQKEYQTRHKWVGKMTHWHFCIKFKFEHTSKVYMHKPESVLKLRCTDFSGILRYKWINSSRPDDKTK